MLNKTIKIIFIISLIFSITALSIVGAFDYILPKNYNILSGDELKLNTTIPINAIKNDVVDENEYNVTLKIFGVIPVSNATVNVIDDYTVNVIGKPFGIKIYTDGVMVVGITDVVTANGTISPAIIGGLQIGDLITSINGVGVLTNEEVAAIIEQSAGKTLSFDIIRDNKSMVLKIKPVKSSSSNKYKAGIWVRDSSAGIGTSTFYCPSLNITAGLGHGICDVDTGEILTINNGQSVSASILNVTKSIAGSPGELKGQFLDEVLGDIVKNDDTGVYFSNKTTEPLENLKKIALKQEISVGEAKIFTCIDGVSPKYYNCVIEKINYNNNITKNMVIRITDSELLEKTGGIVQGMSGSPIIQNNKLVGAVTHVFVNDTTKGYAIFAENMLESAKSIDNKLNNAA